MAAAAPGGDRGRGGRGGRGRGGKAPNPDHVQNNLNIHLNKIQRLLGGDDESAQEFRRRMSDERQYAAMCAIIDALMELVPHP